MLCLFVLPARALQYQGFVGAGDNGALMLELVPRPFATPRSKL